jgi:hypothetical protein
MLRSARHFFSLKATKSSIFLASLIALAIVSFSVAASAADNTLTEEERAEGWLLLFDGESLFGWKAHSEVDWTVVQGEIKATKGEVGLLCTTSNWANYQMKVDFQAPVETNSGVFLRTPPVASRDDVVTKCYELNIAPSDNPFPTGSLVARKKVEKNFDSKAWRQFDITVQGDHVTVKCDGETTVDYKDPKPVPSGLIGLQFNTGAVSFKNVKVRPLGLKPLFNGKDLAGWKTYPKMAGKFSVNKEGYLHVQNGKGQLESADKFGDFVLQLECQTNAKSLNSGLFFRCIPGEEMNGYESQIHNGFKDGDRTKPVDCGTGGVFRRVDARKVVADDETWFQKTIVANGPHVSTWVNGYQVTDWTDTRKPDPNPRKGLRIEAGTLMIQAHDPTTDIFFRNLNAAEIPAP